jgi:hypothetical protein
MTEPSNVTKLRLTSAIAEQRIHELSKETFRVATTTHAKERMAERDITVDDIYKILRGGAVEDDPEEVKPGEWKCKIVFKLKGRRVAGVWVALPKSGKIVVITVEWEDGR